MALNYGVRIAAHRQALEPAPRMFGPTLPGALRGRRATGAVRRPVADSRATVRQTGYASGAACSKSPRCRRSSRRFNGGSSRSCRTRTRRATSTSSSSRCARRRRDRKRRGGWCSASRTAGRRRRSRPLSAETARIFLGFSRFPAAQSTVDADGEHDGPVDRRPVHRRGAAHAGRQAAGRLLQCHGRPRAGRPRPGRGPWPVASARPGPSGVQGPRLGAHMSVAGGLPRAVERGVVHGCEALQIFAKNANQWRGRQLPPEEIRAFRRLGEGVRDHAGRLPRQLPDQPGDARIADLRAQSMEAMGDELDRAEALGLLGVVLHPGCYTDGSEAHGLALIADGARPAAARAAARPDDGHPRTHRRPGHVARRDVRAAGDDHRTR